MAVSLLICVHIHISGVSITILITDLSIVCLIQTNKDPYLLDLVLLAPCEALDLHCRPPLSAVLGGSFGCLPDYVASQ